MASYTLAYYPLLILASAVLWLIYALITCQFQKILDFFLGMYPGVISEQTVSAANFAATCLVCSPAVVLIALAVWALIRGIGSEGY